MDAQRQNDYYSLIIYIWWSLVLTLGIFYFLIPFGHLEFHDWPIVLVLFFIAWYVVYLLLVLGKIFIWDRFKDIN